MDQHRRPATGVTGKAKLYGAVAVGTNVKFYTYRKSDGKLNGLHGLFRICFWG